MLDDVVSSLKTNVLQKVKNPFLGTFIIVWIVRNWKFVYSFFNMDAECTLNERVSIIEGYLQNSEALQNIGFTIGISLLVLFVTYTLLSLSRLIIDFFTHQVNPWISRLNDRGSIVLKSEYRALQAEIIRLEKRVEGERDAKLKIQNEYESLERRLASRLQVETNGNEENPSKNEEESTKSNIQLSLKNLFLNDNEIRTSFLQICQLVLDGKEFSRKNELVKIFVNYGLFEANENFHASDTMKYHLTQRGRDLFDALILDDISRNKS